MAAVRFLLAFVLVAAGCAGTSVPPDGTQGAYTHNIDGHVEWPDLGGPGPVGGGGGNPVGGGSGPDASVVDMTSTPDLIKPPIDMWKPPADMATNGLTGCNGEILCTNNCPTGAASQACWSACQANTTPAGDQKFQALMDCLSFDCPSSYSTDPCYKPTATKCSSCLNQAQAPTGDCAQPLATCQADTP
jgi:hypothetical protein